MARDTLEKLIQAVPIIIFILVFPDGSDRVDAILGRPVNGSQPIGNADRIFTRIVVVYKVLELPIVLEALDGGFLKIGPNGFPDERQQFVERVADGDRTFFEAEPVIVGLRAFIEVFLYEMPDFKQGFLVEFDKFQVITVIIKILPQIEIMPDKVRFDFMDQIHNCF